MPPAPSRPCSRKRPIRSGSPACRGCTLETLRNRRSSGLRTPVSSHGSIGRVGIETLVAGLLIVVGLVGVVVPVLPGLLLVLVGIAVWAVPRNDTIGWAVLGVAVLLVVLGSVAKYLVPGRRLREAGVPTRTLALGG